VPEENFWTLWCNGRLTEADTLTIWLGEPVPEENLLDFYGAKEDNRGEHPDGRHSIRTNSDSPPTSPIFTLDGLPAATLPLYPGLGQAPNMLVSMPSGVVSIQAVTISNSKWSK